MTYVITEACVDIKDKACIEECPVDCIYEGAGCSSSTPTSVDCGACEPVCPVEAIYYEDDVPDQWSQYTQINADFFRGTGLARWCLQGRHDRERPAGGQGSPAQGRGLTGVPDLPGGALPGQPRAGRRPVSTDDR